jgi:hypothetical protein
MYLRCRRSFPAFAIILATQLLCGRASAFVVDVDNVASGELEETVIADMKRKGFVATAAQLTADEIRRGQTIYTFIRKDDSVRMGSFCSQHLVSWSVNSLVHDIGTFIRQVRELTGQLGPATYTADSRETNIGQVNSLSFEWKISGNDGFHLTYTPEGKVHGESISSLYFTANACRTR